MAKKAAAAEAAAERAAQVGVVVPAQPGARLYEFFLRPDGVLDFVVLAVLAWWIAGEQVEPVTLAPERPATVRCVAEAHGSEMTYTFLDAARTRFATITAATVHAGVVLGD